MAKLIIRSAYADMVYKFVSDEETRYYLNGFNVKPHANGGVIIAATDGHTLGVFHEAKGTVETDQQTGDIWSLSKETLKACKPVKRDEFSRWLVIMPLSGTVYDLKVVFADSAETAGNVATSANPDLIFHHTLVTPIDGTFPDTDRVVPTDVFSGTTAPAAYNASYLSKFGFVAGYDFDGSGLKIKPIQIYANDPKSAALVFTNRPDFMGVIMPIKASEHDSLPDWWLEHTQSANSKAA